MKGNLFVLISSCFVAIKMHTKKTFTGFLKSGCFDSVSSSQFPISFGLWNVEAIMSNVESVMGNVEAVKGNVEAVMCS